MKKEIKDQLKAMPVKELQEKLQELETEKQKMEVYLRGFGAKRKSYTADSKKSRKENTFRSGNLKRVKKNIARVKTYLNIKLKNDTLHKKNY